MILLDVDIFMTFLKRNVKENFIYLGLLIELSLN